MTEKYDTIDGIKRAAKKARKADTSLSHIQALEKISKQAGFKSFHAAKQHYKDTDKDTQRILQIQYIDEENPNEELYINLPISSDLSLKEMHNEVYGNAFRKARSKDRLISQMRYNRLDESLRVARKIQFRDITGLRISHDFSDKYGYVDSSDHVSTWKCNKTNAIYMTSEPYRDHYHIDEVRTKKWMRKYNLIMIKSKWAGMHNPYFCPLFIFTHRNNKNHLISLEKNLAKANQAIGAYGPTPRIDNHIYSY